MYAKAFFNRGIAHYFKSEFDQAIVDYTQAIQLYPKYVNAYINRGFTYIYKDEYDQAIVDYTQAIPA